MSANDRSEYFAKRWRERSDVRHASYLRGEARNEALRRLVEAHRDEYQRLYLEALQAKGVDT